MSNSLGFRKEHLLILGAKQTRIAWETRWLRFLSESWAQWARITNIPAHNYWADILSRRFSCEAMSPSDMALGRLHVVQVYRLSRAGGLFTQQCPSSDGSCRSWRKSSHKYQYPVNWKNLPVVRKPWGNRKHPKVRIWEWPRTCTVSKTTRDSLDDIPICWDYSRSKIEF